ncbi:MAG: DoxX family protein [Candidatus Binatia bacterium]
MMRTLAAIRRTALRLLGRVQYVPPLLARLVVGYVFATSGWGKLHNLPHVIDYFTELGIPAPQIQAPFVAMTEFGCGVLVLVGLAARLCAVPLIGTMAVALATALWPDIDGVGGLFGTAEFLYVVLLVTIVVSGPGAVSLDALVVRGPIGSRASSV